ncbi:MAG: iron ABC transporter permease [Pseudomonadota bacterium]
MSASKQLSLYFSIAMALIISLPILYVFAHLFLIENNDVWIHLKETVLADYLINSIALTASVGCLTAMIGISCAWCVSRYHFPMRELLQWALFLPMALPAYILAFTYTGLLDIGGPLQTLIREVMDWRVNEYWFPEIRSLGGACLVVSFVLYPYVYLMVRTSFMQQSDSTLDVGRSLGLNSWAVCFKIAIPMARPAIIAGCSLVMMETLADYGAVQYFGVSTLTTGIFRTWFGMDNPNAAAQLSAFLLFIVFILLYIERLSRQRSKYHQDNPSSPPKRITPSTRNQWLMTLWCSVPVIIGFLIPVVQLLIWSTSRLSTLNTEFLTLCWHSFALASVTSIMTLMIALILHTHQRFFKQRSQQFSILVACLGYAIPGVVIAVGSVVIAGKLDQLSQQLLPNQSLLISGGFGVLIYAYVVRFLAASASPIENGFTKISYHLDECAQSLGLSRANVLRHIHFPLIRNSLLTALLIVFVDTLKELPATLIMRPFNFNTLAVRAYELASDERLADAALPSLAIVATGLIPVILLHKASLSQTELTRRHHE